MAAARNHTLMLTLALFLLLVAATFGGALAALHRRGGSVRMFQWSLRALHGLSGLLGLALLILALRGPPRGQATGVAAFGTIAVILLAVAFIAGLGILALQLRHRRTTSLIIGIHATIAISGIVILAAYVAVG